MRLPTLLTFWTIIFWHLGHFGQFVQTLHVGREVLLVYLLFAQRAQHRLVELQQVVTCGFKR